MRGRMSRTPPTYVGVFVGSMPIVVVPRQLRSPNLVDGNVVISLSEFMDMTLHILVSEALLSRNEVDRHDRFSRVEKC